MEARGWLGLPYLLWGAICLIIALIWVFVWPAAQAADATGLRHLLIRWGHTVTWALLAGMCFIKASDSAVSPWGNLVGLAAVPVYLSFLVATFVLK